VEVGVIAKNLIDANKLSKPKEKVGLIARFKALLVGKDPLLQAVLYENVITLSSTSVPMMCLRIASSSF
jgi:zinc transporter 9